MANQRRVQVQRKSARHRTDDATPAPVAKRTDTSTAAATLARIDRVLNAR